MQAPVDVELKLCYPNPRAREIDRKAVEALAASIKEVGLLSAITVRKVQKSRNGILCDAFEVIAGMHRVKAFRWLQKTHIPAVVIEADDLRAELMLIDENLRRNDLTPAERSAAQARRKKVWQKLHPETMPTKDGGPGRAKTRGKVCHESDRDVAQPASRYDKASAAATGESARKVRLDVHRGEALGDDALAKVARTSLDKGDELDALAKLKKTAPEKCDALIARAASGEKVSAKVEAKKIARQQREADLGTKQQSLPQQKFGVILADPEWKWKPWSDAGMDRGVENTYPTSETTDIAARDVQSIAADDCVLVLWARADMLPEALHVMTAWGFRYVAQRVWRKSRMSTGYWFRYDHELVLIGSRGKPVAPAMGTQERSVFEGEPAVPGLNSSKPECVAEWIERNWPNTPKIELNRRGPARPGWAAWGNQAEPSISESAVIDASHQGEGEPASDPGSSAGSLMDDSTGAQHGGTDRTTPAAPSGDDPRASEQTSHSCEVGAAERPIASRPPQESRAKADGEYEGSSQGQRPCDSASGGMNATASRATGGPGASAVPSSSPDSLPGEGDGLDLPNFLRADPVTGLRPWQKDSSPAAPTPNAAGLAADDVCSTDSSSAAFSQPQTGAEPIAPYPVAATAESGVGSAVVSMEGEGR